MVKYTSLENELNKLRDNDKQFDNKIDFYNFLIEKFYPSSSPMELEDINPQLNQRICKAIDELMKNKFK